MSSDAKIATAEELGLAPGEAVEADITTAASVEYQTDAPWSDEERAKVAAMRKKLEPDFKTMPERDHAYWCSDHAFHRILVARSQDLEAACTMWRHIATFRAQRKCASLLDGPTVYREPETLRRYFPWGFAGVDKDGFPVLVERIGNIDLIGIGQATAGKDGEYESFLNWVCWYHEVQERLMRSATAAAGGRDRHKMCCIIDLAGLSLRHASAASLSVLKRRTRLEEDHYPEVVLRVFLINTPGFFASVWGIIKRFVDPGTAAKFHILGGPDAYLPALRKYIPEGAIPAFLGGGLSDEDGDKECRRMIGAGHAVPLAYLSGVANDGRGAGEELTIPAGKASEVLLHVPAGAVVRWAWATADKDVGFVLKAAKAAGPVPEGAAASGAAGQPIPVPVSVCGAHILAPGFDRKGAPNPYPVPASATAGAATSDSSLPGAAKGAAVVDGTPAANAGGARTSSGFGSWTAPADSAYIVKLRWDNGFSWMAGKSVARRVDVILPTDAAKDEEERKLGAPPVGTPGSILRAADPDDDRARARGAHREKVQTSTAAAAGGGKK